MRARFPHPALTLALVPLLAGAIHTPAWAGTGWIPPRSVTALLPSASFAPGSTHSIEMTLRGNGAPANLNWAATAGGSFALGVSPLNGSIAVPPDSVRRVTLSVTVPALALGAASLSVELTDQIGGGHVAKVVSAIFSASGGMPEVWPSPSSWSAPSNTSGVVSFRIHSTVAGAESLVVTNGRTNPDPNNADALFPGSPPPVDVNLPGGATVTISAPTTIAGSAYGGNANAVQCSITSAAGISTAIGHALSSAALPESLPTALYPVGLAPMGEPAAGRDGPLELAARGVWLVASGADGVRVLSAGSSLARIGAIDTDGNGTDDRLVGQVRIPSYAAAVAVVPGFVGPTGDTLDLGLLAAGSAGLMLLDLRTVVDPPNGTWEDFFDQDGNGIDDRILQSIPLSGFATDVTWFRASTGRIVALVADADIGSIPVAVAYDPDSVAAGTGAGVVAIDVTAAFDSLGGVPFDAGSLATPGSVLDLELRRAGGGSPDLAIADGSSGVSVYRLSAGAGAPAIVTFTPLGSVALSSAWGPPYARDVGWIPNTRDSVYLAVAASAGGMQIVRAPLGSAPSLVMSQQPPAPAIGLTGAWTGNVALALGYGGVALMRAPGGAELNKIAPAGAPPYTAPVTLARGQTWTEGRALEVAFHRTPSSSATSLKFLGTAGPIPDLLVADGARALLLRPGAATIVAVEEGPAPPRAVPLAVSVTPNPMGSSAEIRVFDASARVGAVGAPGAGAVEVEIFDVQGRLVRRIRGASAAAGGSSVSLVRLRWDGRDDRGRRLGSGRYWLRVRAGAREAARSVLILR
jgi:hypothetical protein